MDLPGGPRDAAPGKRGNDKELGETIARGPRDLLGVSGAQSWAPGRQ